MFSASKKHIAPMNKQTDGLKNGAGKPSGAMAPFRVAEQRSFSKKGQIFTYQTAEFYP